MTQRELRKKAVVAGVFFSVIPYGIFLFIAGCQTPWAKAAKAPEEQTQEASPLAGESFQSTAAGAITGAAVAVSSASQASLSAVTQDALGKLHVSGIILICLGLAARLFFGTWRDALLTVVLGLVPSIGAVLLSDYGAIVLLFPACGFVFLAAWGVRKVIEWRTGCKAFAAVADTIESADTGEKSFGQTIKNYIKKSGVSEVVDKALSPLEEAWKTNSK
jgi:hypothetical protein